MKTTSKASRIAAAAFGGLLLRAALTLGSMLMVVGCSADNPMEPVASPTIVKLTNAASFAEMVADVQDRIIPSLPNDAKRTALASSFDSLLVSLRTGDARQVKVALEAANRSIESYASGLAVNQGYDADLDVLRLSTQAISAQLMVDMTGS